MELHWQVHRQADGLPRGLSNRRTTQSPNCARMAISALQPALRTAAGTQTSSCRPPSPPCGSIRLSDFFFARRLAHARPSAVACNLSKKKCTCSPGFRIRYARARSRPDPSLASPLHRRQIHVPVRPHTAQGALSSLSLSHSLSPPLSVSVLVSVSVSVSLSLPLSLSLSLPLSRTTPPFAPSVFLLLSLSLSIYLSISIYLPTPLPLPLPCRSLSTACLPFSTRAAGAVAAAVER